MVNPFLIMDTTDKFTSTGTGWSTLKLQAEYKVSGGIPIYQVELEVTYLITKARRILLKKEKVSSQPWCQDKKTLLHLFVFRSKFIYGQEVHFSAPITLLRKLQSIDSKAIAFRYWCAGAHKFNPNLNRSRHMIYLSK